MRIIPALAFTIFSACAGQAQDIKLGGIEGPPGGIEGLPVGYITNFVLAGGTDPSGKAMPLLTDPTGLVRARCEELSQQVISEIRRTIRKELLHARH